MHRRPHSRGNGTSMPSNQSPLPGNHLKLRHFVFIKLPLLLAPVTGSD